MILLVKKIYEELTTTRRDTPLETNKIAHGVFDEKPELRKKELGTVVTRNWELQKEWTHEG
ncbi:hypothetical protein MKX03_011178 [Papaver bracteatum]|nr:hypothetical protein MKX03_011178 [Papaver bracteatum]